MVGEEMIKPSKEFIEGKETHVKKFTWTAEQWNKWSHIHNDPIDLKGVFFPHSLYSIKFYKKNLENSRFIGSDLEKSAFINSKLHNTNFSDAIFTEASLLESQGHNVDFSRSIFDTTKIHGCDLSESIFSFCNIFDSEFGGPWNSSNWFNKASFNNTKIRNTSFQGSRINLASFYDARMENVIFYGVVGKQVGFISTQINKANFSHAHIEQSFFTNCLCSNIDFTEATLKESSFVRSNFRSSNFTKADLSLTRFIETDLRDCIFSGASVYGTSVWNCNLEGAVQEDLVVTPKGEPEVTVDNLEFAQVVYLALNNSNLGKQIDTFKNKAVTIFGSFHPDELKDQLLQMKDALRAQGYLPIVYDFTPPATQPNIIETSTTLARLSKFVIIDLTSAGPVTQAELDHVAAGVPSVIIVPLIREGAALPDNFAELQEKYSDRILAPIEYENIADVMDNFDEQVIQAAEGKLSILRTSGK